MFAVWCSDELEVLHVNLFMLMNHSRTYRARRLGTRKTGLLRPPVIYYWLFLHFCVLLLWFILSLFLHFLFISFYFWFALFTIAWWPSDVKELSCIKKVNRKVQEEPQAEVAANPWHQEEEKKWHRLTNKCMISAKTSPPFPKQGDQNAKRTEETHRQRAGQGQTWTPRSVNYRVTQNKNTTGTTALEWSVVYTTKGLKAFHCTNFILGPDIILNTKNT